MEPFLYMNNEMPTLEGTKSRACNLELSREYQARGACFKPYRALSNLQ
jgi:hypothetical protein